MPDTNSFFKRWYDEDPIVAKCTRMLESTQDSLKRQTATFLMEEILSSSPYKEMVPDQVYQLIESENRKRRWYDFDEVMRIFLELLRHSSTEVRRQIAVRSITFMEDLLLDRNKSIEIEISDEEDTY